MIKSTLAEQAYRELRDRILGGSLPGGQRLLPNELATELGISPTPVKEACLRLEADGLVSTSSRRGMVVRIFCREDVEELYAGRLLIEKGAVEAAFDAGRLDSGLCARLGGYISQHEKFAASRSLDDLSRALSFDRAFHSELVAAAGIAFISDMHARILNQTHTLFASVTGDYSRSVVEHREILHAIEMGDRQDIINALEAHLARSRHNTLSQVANRAEQLVQS